VACPYFMPVKKLEEALWIHPSRLPLGAGWQGCCGAPGHEGETPPADELKDACNLGYAKSCPRLPQERSCDAVRFAIAKDQGSQVLVNFVFETAHRPAGHGTLAFDSVRNFWSSSHPDLKIQKQAECFLDSYLLRRNRPVNSSLSTSVNA